MFDDFRRWLYWKVWLLMPDEEELLAQLSPEQRASIEQMKRAMGVQFGG